jgi:membrane associated rhomboid family serine protease
MRYNTYYEQTSFALGGGLTRAIKWLILISVASFVVQGIVEYAGSSFWLKAFGLTPDLVNSRYFVWQFFTYLFLHGGIWHLLFNMLALWMFGGELERSWGSREFLTFFFTAGVGAGILYWVFASGLPLLIESGSPHQVLIGSSAAIYGILAAYGLMFPDRTILFMLIFPMKAKWFVLLMAGIEFYLSWTPSPIAHFAHLSGMLIGYLYVRKEWNFGRLGTYLSGWRRHRRLRLVEDSEIQLRSEQDEVDRILDKINARGMSSLSRKELKILQKASSRSSSGRK